MLKRKILRIFLRIVIFSLFGVFAMRCIQLTVVLGDDYYAQSSEAVLIRYDVAADRGDIIAVDGQPLVTNKTTYDITIYRPFLPPEELNGVLFELIKLFDEVSVDVPVGEFNSDYDSLVTLYGLEEYDEPYRRIMCGVRVRMEELEYSYITPYIMAGDIPNDLLHSVLEHSSMLKGVEVTQSGERLIADGDLMPHILGTVGSLWAEEYQELKDEGYSLGDVIGRSGVERAMEEYLRGTNGEVALERNSQGQLVSMTETKEIKPGDTVRLTIDPDLQSDVVTALDATIARLANDGKSVGAGAVVVMDVKTGGVLAAVSYPDYDLNLLYENYEAVANREDEPLFNRALQGLYRPGSTFKPVVALSAATSGISPDETVYCTGVYTHYSDTGFTPGCTGVHGHVDMETALAVSCNVYFYEMGRRLMIDNFTETARMLGLAEYTGIELSEAQGKLASPEQTEQDGGIWYVGDVVQAAIGQGETAVTPIQLAVYTSTLATNGIKPRAHIVESVYSSDLEREQYSPDLSPTETENAYHSVYEVIENGMVRGSQYGPVAEYFTGMEYEIAVKTGSPQTDEEDFDAAIIAYGPVDAPEIAVVAVVEDGGSGYELGGLVREVFDAYDRVEQPYILPEYGVILP